MAAELPEKVGRVHRIDDVALALEEEMGCQLGKLQAQKLCYYAQAWHLAWYGVPLFEGDFEAWRLGPVEPDLYNRQRQDAITPKADPRADSRARAVIGHVVRVYGRLSAGELSDATHAELPYLAARHGLPPEADSRNLISTDDMARYYRRLEAAPDDAARHAIANAELEGAKFTDSHIAALREVAGGDTDGDDLVRELVSRWRARAGAD